MIRTGFKAYEPFRDVFGSLDPLRYPAEEIDKRVSDGRWRCWSDGQAAILAEIKTYPSGVSDVNGMAAAGNLASILELIPLAMEWGREMGCIDALIESRPEWMAALPDWRLHQVCLRKEL